MKKKIIFLVPILRGIGGIETALINLLNNIDNDTYEVDLCVYANYIALKEKIPPTVKLIEGNKIMEYCYVPYEELKNKIDRFEYIKMIIVKSLKKVFGMNIVIKIALRKFKFKPYDVAISFCNDAFLKEGFVGGGNEIVDKCIDAEKKIGWIHNEPYRCGCDKRYYIKIYKNFNYVVNVSYACKDMLDTIVPEIKEKSVVVYNMFDINTIKKKANEENIEVEESILNIVTVSRIENNQKRIDRIIDTSEYMVSKGYKKFRWTIIGDGPDFNDVKKNINNKGLDKYIILMGKLNNPYPYILNADILVQTSDFEAYSMVLQESIILKTPIIVTKYPSAKECVKNGKNGYLVGFDPEEIGDKIIQLSNDEKELKKLNSYIDDNPFTNDIALSQLYKLIED